MVKIEDGTGKGNVARVDSFNRLRTDAVVQPDATFHSRLGDTYAFNSGVLTIPAAMSAGPVLQWQNTDSNRSFFVDRIIYNWNGGSTNFNRTITALTRKNTAAFTTDTATASAGNLNFSSNNTASMTILKWDGTGTAGMSGGGGTATPLFDSILTQGQYIIEVNGRVVLGFNDIQEVVVTPDEAGTFEVAIIGYFDEVNS